MFFIDILKKVLIIVLVAAIGIFAFRVFGQKEKPAEIEKPPVVKTEYQTKTETQFVYVPKEQNEKTDIDANIGKQELDVKVNGQKAVIQKSDDERFVFDKNKLELTQTSKASLDITVPTVDKTKRWGIGAGFGNQGIGYAITFPVSKKNNNLDGWAYHDKDTTSAGIMIRF